jgi:hypothetical protein
MRTSRTTGLHEPTGADRVPEGTLAYFRARNRRRLFELVIGEFERSGLSQADLARRLGRGTDLVCRWLRAPANWTSDTVSDLLFALSGAEADYRIRHPLRTSDVTVIAFPARPTRGTAHGADPLPQPKSESEATSKHRAEAA